MRDMHGARIGLLLILAPWLVAIVAVACYFALVHWANTESEPCGTDTECMQRHGGDGGPANAKDRDTK